MLEFENYAHVTHMKGREMRAPSPQTRATSAGCHTRVKTRLALEDAGEAWTRFVTGGGGGGWRGKITAGLLVSANQTFLIILGCS